VTKIYRFEYTFWFQIPAKNKKEAMKEHDRILWDIAKYIKEKHGKKHGVKHMYIKDCETGRFRGSV